MSKTKKQTKKQGKKAAATKTAKTSQKKQAGKSEPAEEYMVTLDEALELAKGHHMAGNFILADRTYRDILRAVPDHYPTTQHLGVLLYQTGNLEESQSFLKKATKEEPTDKKAWNNLGAVLTDLHRFEEAIKAYDKALEIDPDFVDTINNKALTFWLDGKTEEAEKLSRHSLKISKDNLEGLINLGIALSSQEKYEEALETWKKASELYPGEEKIWINWGNTLRQTYRFAESEVKCRKALEINPDNPETLNNLGNALRDRGQVEEAERCYRKATDLQPDLAEAHNNLAITLCDQGRYEEAVVAARYAAAFKKDDANACSTLSMALRQMGDYPMARAAAQKALYLNPDKAEPYLDMADVNLMADIYDDAEAALQEALKREPDSARVYKKLADVRETMGNNEKALEAIEKAIEMAKDMPLLWVRKGQILQMMNNMDEAFKALDHAISLAEGWTLPLQVKAEMLITVNENKQAEEYVRKALAINDKIPGPYATLASLKKFTKDDEEFKKLVKLGENEKKWGLGGAAVLNYALSDAYAHVGDFDKSFEHLKKANDFKRKSVPYNPEHANELDGAMKEKFTPAFMQGVKGKGFKSDLPVFIVGMPRSGTTLTEQIISSHPRVFGAGELPEIGNAREKFGGVSYENAAEIGQYYIDKIKERDKTGKASRITDKMPGNYHNIGFILSALPDAKIIHCRRNPVDTCLSCYQQNFASGQYWSYNLEEMAEEYNRYLDMMAYWRAILPGSFMEIDYEETVSNFEEQARKLIDFVGLEWDDACLKPHKQKRTVLTASKAQVTRPVYKTSVEKWRRYEKHLKPLVDKIDFNLIGAVAERSIDQKAASA